jgi:hypothetical protein
VERYEANLLGKHVSAVREAVGEEWRVYADGRCEVDANLDQALARLLRVRSGGVVPLIRLLLNSPLVVQPPVDRGESSTAPPA